MLCNFLIRLWKLYFQTFFSAIGQKNSELRTEFLNAPPSYCELQMFVDFYPISFHRLSLVGSSALIMDHGLYKYLRLSYCARVLSMFHWYCPTPLELSLWRWYYSFPVFSINPMSFLLQRSLHFLVIFFLPLFPNTNIPVFPYQSVSESTRLLYLLSLVSHTRHWPWLRNSSWGLWLQIRCCSHVVHQHRQEPKWIVYCFVMKVFVRCNRQFAALDAQSRPRPDRGRDPLPFVQLSLRRRWSPMHTPISSSKGPGAFCFCINVLRSPARVGQSGNGPFCSKRCPLSAFAASILATGQRTWVYGAQWRWFCRCWQMQH